MLVDRRFARVVARGRIRTLSGFALTRSEHTQWSHCAIVGRPLGLPFERSLMRRKPRRLIGECHSGCFIRCAPGAKLNDGSSGFGSSPLLISARPQVRQCRLALYSRRAFLSASLHSIEQKHEPLTVRLSSIDWAHSARVQMRRI